MFEKLIVLPYSCFIVFGLELFLTAAPVRRHASKRLSDSFSKQSTFKLEPETMGSFQTLSLTLMFAEIRRVCSFNLPCY